MSISNTKPLLATAEVYQVRLLMVTDTWFADWTRLPCYAALKRAVSDFHFLGPQKYIPLSLTDRVFNKTGRPLDRYHLNKRLLETVRRLRPQIVFVVKGNFLYPETLRELRKTGAFLLEWSGDDMFLPHNRSRYFAEGVNYYDLVATQKIRHLDEEVFKASGARRLLYQDKSYEKDIHRPMPCDRHSEYLADVSFVGTYEKDRHESLEYLADHGIRISVYGSFWKGKIRNTKNLIWHGRDLMLDEYAACLSCSKISLGFLRKMNFDVQTCRSIEIPACGGFLLTERTDAHRRLFEEDKEAVFFSSNEELLDKLRYYLKHDSERQAVAEAGYRRCLRDDYSFDRRMREVLEISRQIAAGELTERKIRL